MPQRRTAFTWTIHYDDPLMAGEVVDRVKAALALWQARKPLVYSDGWIGGAEFGLLQVRLTVTRRDRWECSRRAREFARALAVTARVRMVEVCDPDPDNLKPHTHRGRDRFLAPKYAEVPDGS